MRKFRPLLWAFLAIVLVPSVALALQSQRAQLPVTIIIDVTPNPLGYTHGAGASDAIVAHATLRGAPPAIERAFEAEQLHFVPSAGGILVAQTAKQKALEVEAEVTPNPNATLLTTSAGGGQVEIPAEAGVAKTVSCAYTVQVQTTQVNWELKDGLFSDFTNGTTTWPGGDVAHATYVVSPAPTQTPFIVYSKNGGVWAVVNGTYSGTKNFCVDLTLNIPISTPQGQYTSNAVYTLYY